MSTVLDDGSIVELLYRPAEHRTVFCIGKEGSWRYEAVIRVGQQRLVPYSPGNNLITSEVVLFPSEPEEYGTEEELVVRIQTFIHRYVDVGPLYEKIASYYVMFSWVYDAFNELPYLRVRGDFGSGKTRFLLIVGYLCYKPIFASGASTVSPLFRLLDSIRGTLIIDEGDFRVSDERAEVVKILNNGNARGFPVLRSEVSGNREFNPRAYAVFGPKIVATRGFFDDRALESRFLTEEMGQRALRQDIPINLTAAYKEEALHVRNQLLLFRLRTRQKRGTIEEGAMDRAIEPRLNQIFLPLLSIIDDAKARNDLLHLAQLYNDELIADRGMDTEAQVLEVIRDLLAAQTSRLAVMDIAKWFADRHQEDYERKVTPKWIGWIVRKRLRLQTRKSRGVFVIPSAEQPTLDRLFEKYGIARVNGTTEHEPSPRPRDIGDFGDIARGDRHPPVP